MANIAESIRNVLKIQELRTRLMFTAALLIVVRIGAHVTLPGVDAPLLARAEASQETNQISGQINQRHNQTSCGLIRATGGFDHGASNWNA